MKKASLVLSLLLLTVASYGAADIPGISGLFPSLPSVGNPDLVPVEEEPGPNAELLKELVHSKEILVDSEGLKLKWTELAYGALTEKIIIQDIAKHTLFNHRNPGEEGPCLRSYRSQGEEGELDLGEEISVQISVSNQYEINREKKICRVSMVEDVKTEIDGVKFTHTYTKTMGFRYIGDCPGAAQ